MILVNDFIFVCVRVRQHDVLSVLVVYSVEDCLVIIHHESRNEFVCCHSCPT